MDITILKNKGYSHYTVQNQNYEPIQSNFAI